jgi:hypothetical protein
VLVDCNEFGGHRGADIGTKDIQDLDLKFAIEDIFVLLVNLNIGKFNLN